MKKSLLLLILDGWGIRNEIPGNAIKLAYPSYYDFLLSTYPNITLDASGEAVGLPAGQMGNSEVGHLNMGAGRIVFQEITRINRSIREKEFFQNAVLQQAIQHAKQHQSTLHLMGLVSDGGVHSSLDHLLALLDLTKEAGLEQVRVHAFLDGRDVGQKSAERYLAVLEKKLLDCGFPQIATVSGRYYAMDRDNRWERIEKAYHNIVQASGRRHPFSIDSLLWSYNQDITDEFVAPSVCDFSYQGLASNDSAIFFNFRPDRARQLTRALTQQPFEYFERPQHPANFYFACLTLYDETFNLPVAYPKQRMDRLLAEVLSEQGLTQFRTAETEKYAHVTFFFNGGFEPPYPGEVRQLIPSPTVATYDLQPEMHIQQVTNVVCEAVASGQYDFIVVNFANPDMVGHTGNLPAAEQAVMAVDKAIKQVTETVLSHNGTLLLTADHGNCEVMIDANGNPHTAHTTNLVPLVLVSDNPDFVLDSAPDVQHNLSEIAPTILDLLGIAQPPEMTSQSLLVYQANATNAEETSHQGSSLPGG